MRLNRQSCRKLMPFARTFVIGLAVLGLLVPGGLVMTLCRCDMGGGQLMAADSASGCCTSPQSTRVQTGGPHSPPSAQRPPCSSCHVVVVSTPERESLAPALSVHEFAPLALWTRAPTDFASVSSDRERLALDRHGLAPPGLLRSLPLRI